MAVLIRSWNCSVGLDAEPSVVGLGAMARSCLVQLPSVLELLPSVLRAKPSVKELWLCWLGLRAVAVSDFENVMVIVILKMIKSFYK